MVNLIVKMNEQQSALVLKALELYTRIGTGQLSELLWHPGMDAIHESKRSEAEEALYTLKKLAFSALKHSGDSLSIRNDDVAIESKNAYDIMQVMKHELALADNAKNSEHSVWRFEPRKAGDQPFIECKVTVPTK